MTTKRKCEEAYRKFVETAFNLTDYFTCVQVMVARMSTKRDHNMEDDRPSEESCNYVATLAAYSGNTRHHIHLKDKKRVSTKIIKRDEHGHVGAAAVIYSVLVIPISINSNGRT